MPKQFNTILSIFADDTAILARNKNHNYIQIALNRHLKTLEDWFAKWKIQINAGKTEAIMFTNSRRPLPPIKVNNQIIPWSQECKYLGVILDKRLTWKPHFLYIKKKFRELTRKFYPLIARNSKMTRSNMLLIYTAYLRPVLSYACPVWGYAAKSNIKLLEKEQNLLIRNICHAKCSPHRHDHGIILSGTTNTGFPHSQELATIPLPAEFQINKEELADLFRLLKQIQLIMAKVPNVKQTLTEMEKTEDPYNKLFILSEEMNGT
ncbi:RNA-directed DNA polymerase from mobile element jockey [Araneus ventricosus]|uniref:RNA-directed DNA polymerase from mobile element jockey n=1 Tax=Araneus ventricosus TaxID=182803 RepID=A0A4Y2P4U3_ARAVE|nr:RNA-directed DNA polymerase from mobile element jockey [Araneus ventricosus]